MVRGGEQPNGMDAGVCEYGWCRSIQYNYYVVVHDSGGGYSFPLYAGYAVSSGSGNDYGAVAARCAEFGDVDDYL